MMGLMEQFNSAMAKQAELSAQAKEIEIAKIDAELASMLENYKESKEVINKIDEAIQKSVQDNMPLLPEVKESFDGLRNQANTTISKFNDLSAKRQAIKLPEVQTITKPVAVILEQLPIASNDSTTELPAPTLKSASNPDVDGLPKPIIELAPPTPFPSDEPKPASLRQTLRQNFVGNNPE